MRGFASIVTPRLSRNAAHAIDIVGRPDDQAEMIERAAGRRPRRSSARRPRRRAVQREIVDARRQVDVVGVGLPLDGESQQST